MKAIVAVKQGPPDVLQLREAEKPTPKDNEVLVKVHVATVTRGDVILRRLPAWLFPLLLPLRFLGLRRKSIPGTELAGEVAAIGTNVTRFKPGDHVFGTTTGLGVGANAEYVCLPERWKTGVLARKPAGVPYEGAAAVPVGGMTALQILRKAHIQPGQKVLIYGASGSVGTYAVQLAKHYGAEVTGVCSKVNLDLAKSIGASNVIDYTKQDFAQTGEAYDVVFDAVGKISRSRAKPVLKARGRYLTVKSMTRENNEDLAHLGELLESGALKPVIDRTYPLEQAAEAHKYVETGRKRGNVVIAV
ncbi:MAG: NAD(P)-dependent alcohol dehydrogenase [SAR202 cluster bacterium]|nr:NAD(P)-dependent alcohol dehydrogenase [SAR202 cluster bacterium]